MIKQELNKINAEKWGNMSSSEFLYIESRLAKRKFFFMLINFPWLAISRYIADLPKQYQSPYL